MELIIKPATDEETIEALKNTIERLQQQIKKMKCCFNCSKWNDGECEEAPKAKTYFCADFKCDNWECMK